MPCFLNKYVWTQKAIFSITFIHILHNSLLDIYGSYMYPKKYYQMSYLLDVTFYSNDNIMINE